MRSAADVSSEFGVIRVPGRQWNILIRAIRDINSSLLAARYEQALEIYVHLKGAGKRRRNFDWHRAYQGVAVSVSDPTLIFKALFVRGGVHLARPRVPRKADFRVTRRVDVFSFGTLTLRFDHATHVLVWEIPTGRHAVEQVYGDPHVTEVIEVLNNLTWAKHTGGVIRRKGCVSGNTVATRFGPIGAGYGVKKTDRRPSEALHQERRRGLPLL